ncbi:MAG: GNAT family N-acetyltransferase [Thermogutta sp.]
MNLGTSPITPLSWDSEHFGFPIGSLVWSGDPVSLAESVQNAIQADYRLLYVFSPTNCQIPPQVQSLVHDIFESGRVEYRKSLDYGPGNRDLPDTVVRLTPENCDWDVVQRLGVVAGEKSRFLRDPHFPREKALHLYEIWAEDSVRGRLADVVLGTTGKLGGMVTLCRKGEIASVGLLAVLPEYRGRGWGTTLLRSAEYWAANWMAKDLCVATQTENTTARKLYESMGFRRHSESRVFHLWLTK